MPDDVFFAIRAVGRVEDVGRVLSVVEELNGKFDAFLQVAGEGAVFDEAHAQSAWRHAKRANEAGDSVSDSLGGEFLRYLTARRQVAKAIEAGGISSGDEAVVVVGGGPQAGAAVWGLLDRLGWSRDPAGLEQSEAVLERLGVGAAERGATPRQRWSDLVLERVAMLDAQRR